MFDRVIAGSQGTSMLEWRGSALVYSMHTPEQRARSGFQRGSIVLNDDLLETCMGTWIGSESSETQVLGERLVAEPNAAWSNLGTDWSQYIAAHKSLRVDMLSPHDSGCFFVDTDLHDCISDTLAPKRLTDLPAAMLQPFVSFVVLKLSMERTSKQVVGESIEFQETLRRLLSFDDDYDDEFLRPSHEAVLSASALLDAIADVHEELAQSAIATTLGDGGLWLNVSYGGRTVRFAIPRARLADGFVYHREGQSYAVEEGLSREVAMRWAKWLIGDE